MKVRRTRSSSIWLALAALAVVATACGTGVRGSGNVVTESRTVSGFDEVVLKTSGTVAVDVTGSESLEIEAEDNILPLLTNEVVDGRLELGASESLSAQRSITYTITASNLAAIDIEGSGDVRVTALDTDAFEAAIGGSGFIDVAGRGDTVVIVIDGSGDVDTTDVDASSVVVTINGSGSAAVSAADRLEATINGSGDVAYVGDPTLVQEINGSGEVRKR